MPIREANTWGITNSVGLCLLQHSTSWMRWNELFNIKNERQRHVLYIALVVLVSSEQSRTQLLSEQIMKTEQKASETDGKRINNHKFFFIEKCILLFFTYLMHTVGIGSKMEFIVHVKNSVDWLNEYHVHVNNEIVSESEFRIKLEPR